MNAVVKTNPQDEDKKTVKSYVSDEKIRQKFEEILGKKTQGFLASVMQVCSQPQLKDAIPATVVNAAMMAATLDLPINNNLGFAYIVPYKKKVNNVEIVEAQFQLGYKGFIQLAQRSGQFSRIAATPVYEGQVISENPLLGYEFDWSIKPDGEPIGYVAFFKLINGFTAELYMSKAEIMAHAGKFSQTFKSAENLKPDEQWKKKNSVWHTQFEAMALKTVLKLLLSKQAPLSIEMQTAQLADQAIVRDVESSDFEYIDHQTDEVQVTQIDLTNNPTEFDRLSNAIAMGDLEKMEVLSGERYIISDEQRSQIAGM